MVFDIDKPLLKTWWIGYNLDMAFFHFGICETDQRVTSDLDTVEIFTDEASFEARAAVLNIDISEM